LILDRIAFEITHCPFENMAERTSLLKTRLLASAQPAKGAEPTANAFAATIFHADVAEATLAEG
jgi:hypothetical protein